MIEGVFYMNKMNVDICFEVVRIIRTTPIQLIVNYWNLGYNGKPFLFQSHVKLTFTKDQYDAFIEDCSEITPELLKIKRTKPGHPRLSLNEK